MAFARCGPVCALRSHLRSLGAQKNKNIFSKRKMLTELKEVKHIIFARDAGMGAWHLARSVCVLMAFARCDPVCALQSRLRSLGIQKNISAVPFAFIGNTEKQKYVFKRKMLTEFEEVKHITFAHYGGMGGNGTWLSPFAFSWRLRAAVPFALIRNTEKQK